MKIKKINSSGIPDMQKLDGTDSYYYGTDYTCGDLYEAEEIYNSGKSIKGNRLVFVKYPSGEVFEPILPSTNRYFGIPIFDGGYIYILRVDFEGGKVIIYRFYAEDDLLETFCSLDRSDIPDCYNLLLHRSPVFLTHDGNDGKYTILFPEKSEFETEENEVVYRRDGDILISSKWYENPYYHEDVILRKYPCGEITDRFNGALKEMPNGEYWLIK